MANTGGQSPSATAVTPSSMPAPGWVEWNCSTRARALRIAVGTPAWRAGLALQRSGSCRVWRKRAVKSRRVRGPQYACRPAPCGRGPTPGSGSTGRSAGGSHEHRAATLCVEESNVEELRRQFGEGADLSGESHSGNGRYPAVYTFSLSRSRTSRNPPHRAPTGQSPTHSTRPQPARNRGTSGVQDAGLADIAGWSGVHRNG